MAQKVAFFAPRNSPSRLLLLQKTPFFFEFSPCLSRACLGKKIAFIYKWRKKWRFSHRSYSASTAPHPSSSSQPRA